MFPLQWDALFRGVQGLQPLDPLQVGFGMENGRLAQGAGGEIVGVLMFFTISYQLPNIAEEDVALLLQEYGAHLWPHERQDHEPEEQG